MQKDYSCSQTRQAKYRALYRNPRASAMIVAAQEYESSRRREAENLVVQGLRAAGCTGITTSRFNELVDEALAKSTEQKDYSYSQTCQAKYRARYVDSRASATIVAAQEDESSRRQEAQNLVVRR